MAHHGLVAAQKRKYLEPKAEDTAGMCVNGCDFYGTAATGYMCSKCYKGLVASDPTAPPEKKAKTIVSAAIRLPGRILDKIVSAASSDGGEPSVAFGKQPQPQPPAATNRCATCRDKGPEDINGELFAALTKRNKEMRDLKATLKANDDIIANLEHERQKNEENLAKAKELIETSGRDLQALRDENANLTKELSDVKLQYEENMKTFKASAALEQARLEKALADAQANAKDQQDKDAEEIRVLRETLENRMDEDKAVQDAKDQQDKDAEEIRVLGETLENRMDEDKAVQDDLLVPEGLGDGTSSEPTLPRRLLSKLFSTGKAVVSKMFSDFDEYESSDDESEDEEDEGEQA